MKKNLDIAIGIDLGTCFSASAYIDQGIPKIIPNHYGNAITPSCVAISHDEILVGEDANFVKNDPDFTYIEKSKILMGTSHIYHTPQGDYTPEDIASIILKHVLDYSNEFLRSNINNAVVTVPAYFNANQRRLTKEAAEKSGINVLRIISEPTAASLISGSIPEGSKILVYDLGGGTFDCSILEVYHDWARVIATHGDTNLGGKNFDEAIASHLVKQWKGLGTEKQIKLLDICEKTKKGLTNRDQVFVPINEIDSKLLPIKLTYKDFKTITKSLVDTTKYCIFECLKDAELEFSSINKVYMVGGSTRMRVVEEMLSSLFSVTPESLGNPDESVALGSAIHANDIYGKEASILLIDAIPLSLGIKLENGICKKIMMRNSPIPGESEEIFTTAQDNQEKVVIEIYQGENELAKNNVHIGTLELSGIHKGLRGEPKILVSFEVDSNAVLSVKASDLHTGVTTESKFNYNINLNVESKSEEIDLLLLSLKEKLFEFSKRQNISEEDTKLIEDALQDSNVEFVQSVVAHMQELSMQH